MAYALVMDPQPALPIGPEALRAALKNLPPSPGCYQMMDAAGKILYIGKAKNLVNRVGSYTNLGNHNTRILRMVLQVARVEHIVTKNEAEALLMEASLIKRHMPRYNVLLKDDKSFPYIRLDTSHPFPRIEKHRGAQNLPGEYFGPFANVGALNAAMVLLQKLFLLRPCSDSYFKNRTRPCLQFQIKRCTAPCVNLVQEREYAEQIRKARDFLKGKSREIQEELTQEMNAASEAMDYERAAALRDRIRALTQVQQQQGLRVAGLKDADVIGFARRGDKSVVLVAFYRDGQPLGQQSFHPRHGVEESDGEILSNFIGQFYQAHLPPEEILVGFRIQDSAFGEEDPANVEKAVLKTTGDEDPLPECRILNPESSLLEQALTLRAGYKVALHSPQRGDKRELVANAHKSAEAALMKLEMERASIETQLVRVQALFQLPRVPQRIEVYDNSHISGTHALGAFIVATPEGFDKKSYRTFNIKDAATQPGDDYAMMREVMRRRFRGVTEGGLTPPSPHEAATPAASGSREALHTPTFSESQTSTLPDLVLIDGGIGQLHAVEEVLKSMGVTGVALVAIAKGEDRNAGREWFHQPGRAPFQLPINDPVLHYLQRLRDEVHRFVIGRHRRKRSKSLTTSALDDIPGIGPTRKRALLQHFGSRADVATATLAELEKVRGINKATARVIYDYFHG